MQPRAAPQAGAAGWEHKLRELEHLLDAESTPRVNTASPGMSVSHGRIDSALGSTLTTDRVPHMMEAPHAGKASFMPVPAPCVGMPALPAAVATSAAPASPAASPAHTHTQSPTTSTGTTSPHMANLATALTFFTPGAMSNKAPGSGSGSDAAYTATAEDIATAMLSPREVQTGDLVLQLDGGEKLTGAVAHAMARAIARAVERVDQHEAQVQRLRGSTAAMAAALRSVAQHAASVDPAFMASIPTIMHELVHDALGAGALADVSATPAPSSSTTMCSLPLSPSTPSGPRITLPLGARALDLLKAAGHGVDERDGVSTPPPFPFSSRLAPAIALAHVNQPEALCEELLRVARAAADAKKEVSLVRNVLRQLQDEFTRRQRMQQGIINNLTSQLEQCIAENERMRSVAVAAAAASASTAATFKLTPVPGTSSERHTPSPSKRNQLAAWLADVRKHVKLSSAHVEPAAEQTSQPLADAHDEHVSSPPSPTLQPVSASAQSQGSDTVAPSNDEPRPSRIPKPSRLQVPTITTRSVGDAPHSEPRLGHGETAHRGRDSTSQRRAGGEATAFRAHSMSPTVTTRAKAVAKRRAEYSRQLDLRRSLVKRHARGVSANSAGQLDASPAGSAHLHVTTPPAIPPTRVSSAQQLRRGNAIPYRGEIGQTAAAKAQERVRAHVQAVGNSQRNLSRLIITRKKGAVPGPRVEEPGRTSVGVASAHAVISSTEQPRLGRAVLAASQLQQHRVPNASQPPLSAATAPAAPMQTLLHQPGIQAALERVAAAAAIASRPSAMDALTPGRRMSRDSYSMSVTESDFADDADGPSMGLNRIRATRATRVIDPVRAMTRTPAVPRGRSALISNTHVDTGEVSGWQQQR